ncbi:MAG: family 78 glycoside hydrolase catalytic domain [Thermoguttaceae bacterium]|nr:family 78 glycoside hydrolase catalytic domain [Thermoguttaceae bacterium]
MSGRYLLSLLVLGALCLGALSPRRLAADTAPEIRCPTHLLTDLLEDTETVRRGGFPCDVSLEEADETTEFARVASALPTFSWVVPHLAPNTRQSAYEIELYQGSSLVWTSTQTQSDASVSVPYTGPALAEDTLYRWRVRVCDQAGQWSDWSEEKRFRTAKDLRPFAVSAYPSVFEVQEPISDHAIDENTVFYDFGRAAFARVAVTVSAPRGGTMTVRLGERVADGRVDRHPAGTTRYAEYTLQLEPGRKTYEIQTRRDQRNSSGAAFLVPPYLGEVMPLRYAEIEFAGAAEDARPVIEKFVRFAAFYHFSDSASSFQSDNDALDRVWDFCKYSIKATSFLGVYIDGDRERIPYEGDALLNQLSHYAVDREYTMARRTIEYLIEHPTWPTEWILQTVQMAWYDYLYTGDNRLIAAHYDQLKAKSLIELAGGDGLISTRTGKQTDQMLASIYRKEKIQDIVDWPHKGLAGNDNASSGETDDFVFEDLNAVVNAYHYFALRSMRSFAEILGKQADVTFFENRAAQVYRAYQEKFFDPARGIYRDGAATDHASLHTNMFALAFGLVPEEHTPSVLAFLRTRGMRCSVYGAQFLLDAIYDAALYDSGADRYGLELLTADQLRGWLNMMRAGSTISMEAWDDRYKPNQDWNHAWGAAPANIIPRKLVGVEPLTPGAGKIRVAPRIAALENISARVPTIRGPVEVVLQQSQERCRLEVTIPANVTAEVLLPARQADTLTVDSDLVQDPKRLGRCIVLPEIGSGSHVIEVKRAAGN